MWQQAERDVAAGREGCGSRQRGMWQQTERDVAAGREGCGCRQRGMWQQAERDVAAGRQGCGSRQTGMWQQAERDVAAGREGCGCRQRGMWQQAERDAEDTMSFGKLFQTFGATTELSDADTTSQSRDLTSVTDGTSQRYATFIWSNKISYNLNPLFPAVTLTLT